MWVLGNYRRNLLWRMIAVAGALLLLAPLAAWAEPMAGGGNVAALSDQPAAAPAISTSNLWRMLIDGGPLMIVLAGCSFMVITFVLERFVSLRRSRVIPKPFVTRFIDQLKSGELDREQSLKLCEENGSPVAQVFAGAVRKWGRPSVEVEQAAIDHGGCRVSSANLADLPEQLRPFFGPFGEQPGLVRNSVPLRPAPLRPVIRQEQRGRN